MQFCYWKKHELTKTISYKINKHVPKKKCGYHGVLKNTVGNETQWQTVFFRCDSDKRKKSSYTSYTSPCQSARSLDHRPSHWEAAAQSRHTTMAPKRQRQEVSYGPELSETSQASNLVMAIVLNEDPPPLFVVLYVCLHVCQWEKWTIFTTFYF